MRFKDCTIGYVKSIYLMGVEAQENQDIEKLIYLNLNYPEIFDDKFIMDVLKNERERITKDLDDSMPFKTELFVYH